MEGFYISTSILQPCFNGSRKQLYDITALSTAIFHHNEFIRKLMLFLFLLISCQGFAQSFTSSETELSTMPSDTAKVNLLIKLAEQNVYSDAEKSLLFSQEALVLSTQLNYKKGIADCFLWQGRAYYYKDEYNLAGEYLSKARTVYEDLNDLGGMVKYHFFMGSIHQITGNLLAAMRDFQLGVELCKITGNQKMLIYNYCALGSIHLARSEPRLAMASFNEARTLTEKTGQQAGMAILMSNIASAHELLEAYDSAYYYYSKSHEIRIADGGIRGIASSELIIGRLLIKMGKYREALDYLELSFAKFTDLKDDAGICFVLMELAKATGLPGETGRAVSLGAEAANIAEKLKNPELMSQSYANLSTILALDGRHQEAFKYLLMHNYLRDSLAVVNNEKIISELEIQFQTARKEAKIELLKSQNEIQRKNNLLLVVSISTLSAILILALILFRLKWAGLNRQQKLLEHESTIRDQESKLKDKEQQFLKAELEAKNRGMASKALEMLRINETIESIIEKLDEIRKVNHTDDQLTVTMRSIISELEFRLKSNSWEEFEKIFNNIHSEFYQKLLEICPDISPSEIKIAALLKLNLSTKEIAAIAFKSEAGIKSTRFRLRKKLGLNSDDSLIPFLMHL